MKKLWIGGLLVCVLFVQVACHAATEEDKEKFRHEILKVGDGIQAYDIVEIERVLDAGVNPDTPVNREPLRRALCSRCSMSGELVALLIRKGASIKTIDEYDLRSAVIWGVPFEQKKIKILALMDAGFFIDREFWSVVDGDLINLWREMGIPAVDEDEQRELVRLIEDTLKEGPRWRAALPEIMKDILPVQTMKGHAVLIDLVGQYAHPYYDYQEPESVGQEMEAEEKEGCEPERKKRKLSHDQEVAGENEGMVKLLEREKKSGEVYGEIEY